MTLEDDLVQMRDAAVALGEGKELAGVFPVDALGRRVYLCAFRTEDDGRAWLVLGDAGVPVVDRQLVREAASLATLCEIVEDHLVEVELPQAQARLAAVPNEEAEAAAAALVEVLSGGTKVRSGEHLDELGAAARQLEQALGEGAVSPFASALQAAFGSVAAFADDVERNYTLRLE